MPVPGPGGTPGGMPPGDRSAGAGARMARLAVPASPSPLAIGVNGANGGARRKSMGKLFVKLWLLILLTSLVSYRIQDAVFDRVYSEQMASISNERVRRGFAYIEEALRPYPQAEWPRRFEEMKARVGSPKVFMGPARLLPLAELQADPAMKPDALERIRTHQSYVGKLPQGQGTEIYHTLFGGDMVAVIEIPFMKTPPMYGILTPQQFTWVLESCLYALAVGLWLTLFWRDMKKLDRAAREVGEGNFGFTLDIRPGAALYPLADSFNRMKARIAALLGSHRNLTNAVSHEFRTPITRLRFRHELAMNAATPAEKDRQLALMDTAIDQLDELSAELLEYARMDRETPRLDIGPIDALTWLEELAEEAREVARAEGRSVDIRVVAGAGSADGDYRYLTRAAANLLRNAVRYAAARVDLTFEQSAGQSVLAVDDDGPGIPAAERERLFEPFTRLDASRDRQSGGFGMGLAIVRQVARWHGGQADITQSALGGARVSMSW